MDGEDKIIEEYQAGIPLKDIAKKYGYWNNSITRMLRRRGIGRTQRAPKVKDNIEKTNLIIDKYVNQRISSEVIAKELGINGTTVCRILKRNNILIRPGTENKTKYLKDLTFFKKIDTEAKAYFLGLLYADGSVSESSHCLRLTDQDVLIKFSDCIFGINLVKFIGITNGGKPFYGVYVYSAEMRDDLVALGCPEDKAFKIKFPFWLEKDLWPHFIRGYLDGDGCICPGNPAVDFTGCGFIIDDFIKIFKEELNITGWVGEPHTEEDKPPENNTKCLQIRAYESIKTLLDYIYINANIYMERKYKLYQEFLLKFDEYGQRYFTNEEKKLISEKWIGGMTQTKIAEEYDVNVGTISKILDRALPDRKVMRRKKI